MKAVLSNYRHSPRKVRLVADMVRGKKIEEAISMLSFLTKRAAAPVEKLLRSAAANAKANHGVEGDLIVKEIAVNKGPVLKRMMPRARGAAAPIHKHSSHVSVTLAAAKK